ncbi:MAG: hypothetical protein L3J93_03085 [Thermoplasmata archaeon]|nr:hypothetical protein [Thermoplasmata archaeon]
MLSATDHRSFSSVEDRYQRCLFCGKNLVVLPDDHRDGCCFDCRSLLGLERIPCPECGQEMAIEASASCGRCGWSAPTP